MSSLHHIPTLISKKRDGKSLTGDEIDFLVNAIANRKIDDAQIGESSLGNIVLYLGERFESFPVRC